MISFTRTPVLSSRKNLTLPTGLMSREKSQSIARLNIRLSRANSRFTVEPETSFRLISL